MYQGHVHLIRRGMFGPKHIEVYSRLDTIPERIMAEMSRYHDDWHVKSFKDLTGSHGDHDERPEPGPTAWDAATGEPVGDDRDRASYHDNIAADYAPDAQAADESMPF